MALAQQCAIEQPQLAFRFVDYIMGEIEEYALLESTFEGFTHLIEIAKHKDTLPETREKIALWACSYVDVTAVGGLLTEIALIDEKLARHDIVPAMIEEQAEHEFYGSEGLRGLLDKIKEKYPDLNVAIPETEGAPGSDPAP